MTELAPSAFDSCIVSNARVGREAYIYMSLI